MRAWAVKDKDTGHFYCGSISVDKSSARDWARESNEDSRRCGFPPSNFSVVPVEITELDTKGQGDG